MSRWFKGLVARILMLLCLFLWGCFVTTPVNITGTWTGTMEWTSGPATGFTQPISFVLLHEGRDVTGTVTLPSSGGSSFDVPIIQGSARSVNLSLVARGTNDQVPGNPTIEFRVDGQYEQAVMSGDGTQLIGTSVYSFDWQAVLITEPVVPARL